MTKADFKGKDLVSINDLSKEEIEEILIVAKKIKTKQLKPSLKGKLMASCFFEPSTRTRLSFEAAMHRLGGDVIGFSEPASTSVKKGESLADTIRIISGYSDLIVIRHPYEGAARLAAEMAEVPVINAGDGANEHPTQTLLDLFTIQESFGRIEDLKIAFVGDLKYGRTVHSLALALRHFPSRLFFVSPETLTIPENISRDLKEAGVPFSFHAKIEEVIGKIDLLYMTRIQAERFMDRMAFEEVKEAYHLTDDLLNKGREHLKVMHPLPRVMEIDYDLDKTSHALYFLQANNGLFVREALLTLIL